MITNCILGISLSRKSCLSLSLFLHFLLSLSFSLSPLSLIHSKRANLITSPTSFLMHLRPIFNLFCPSMKFDLFMPKNLSTFFVWTCRPSVSAEVQVDLKLFALKLRNFSDILTLGAFNNWLLEPIM